MVDEQELLAEAFCTKAGRKITISVPQRGDRKDLTDNALQNAREALGRRLAETSTQGRLFSGFAQTFGLARVPRRIEVYDNSHIMGTHAVGGMIVAGPGGFMKSHYRTFNIKSDDITPGDDYGMMREVLRRRFARLLKDESAREVDGAEAAPVEDPDAFPARPDLIVIDGGRGQFDAARQIFAELGVEGVALISIAKGLDREAGRETFFVEGREPFRLPVRDPALYFVQRLRDEAHRFAIGTHRARRKKDFTKSPLDEIAGIGPARKRALLNAFGTAKAIAHAGLGDLEKVAGINAATAKLVYDHFHEG